MKITLSACRNSFLALFLTMSGLGYSQYCATPSSNCSLSDEIQNVTFAGIDNDSSCGTGGYGDFTTGTAGAVTTGQAYTLSVTTGDGGGESIGVFIDFNQNQTFEADEFYYVGYAEGGTVSTSILIPESALTGTTRMRVRNVFTLSADPAALYAVANSGCVTLGTYGETEDYTLTVAAGVPCTGTPEIGAITASETAVCGGTEFTVSASVGGAFIGFLYQLETSTDGGTTWVDSGDEQSLGEFTVTQAAGTSYRITVTCVASGESDTSEVIAVAQSPVADCYCTPGVDNPLNCTDGDIMLNVTFGTIDNTSDCGTDGYTNYSGEFDAVELMAGQSYPISVTVGPSGEGWLFESVGVWIDYNQDGAFGEDEFTDVGTGLDETLTSSITVPDTALEGNTRMRVLTSATTDAAFNATYACSPLSPDNNFGEIEDYIVNITNDLKTGDITKGLVGLYPNPTQNVLNISVKNGVQLQSAEIYNVTGQRVMNQSFEASAEGVMNVQDLAAGVYIVKLTTDQGVASQRLIKK